MGKIYKMNKTGTCGVSMTKDMKAAGFVAGATVEWFVRDGGFILMLMKASDKAQEPLKHDTGSQGEPF